MHSNSCNLVVTRNQGVMSPGAESRLLHALFFRLTPHVQVTFHDAADETSTDGSATCCICLEDNVPQASMYSLACQHDFCGDCLRQHVTVAVEDARMVPR